MSRKTCFSLLAGCLFPALAFANESPTVSVNDTVDMLSAKLVLNSSILCYNDDSTTDGELVYTLTATPGAGTLSLSGTDLNVGGTFTQADIDSGWVSFSYTGSAAALDSFAFTVSDGSTDAVADTFYMDIRLVFSGGQGDLEHPWEISTTTQLDSVRNHLSGRFSLVADLEFTDADFAEDGAFYNSGSGWRPIGKSGTPFYGYFNGKGHSITGLYINRSSTSNVGLFGYISGASSIDSLGLVNCDITGYNNVGGLVGHSYSYTTVYYCYATGRVSGNGYVGGLVGSNDHYANVSNCYATVDVSGSTSYVGGLLGYNFYYSVVYYSYATGNVSGNAYVGGLVGYNYFMSSVYYSYATGDVSGSSSFVGGLVGYNLTSTTVSYCYATGSVSGGATVGGLAGRNYSATVSYCHFDTETSGQSAGIGEDNFSQTVTGLTTAQMKQSGNFTGWDSSTVWAFRADSTYPALRAVDNAPFAFADTLNGSVSALLANDFDYETLKENLVYEIDSVYSITNSSAYSSLSEASNGDSLLVRYRIGEQREAKGDTLWGNQAWDCLKLDNTAPAVATDLDTSTAEDFALTLSLDWIANDPDGDPLSYSMVARYGSATISRDSLTYTPATDWYGEDTVEVVVTDGNLSDTGFVYISVTAVNDAPVLSAVTDTSTLEDEAITLVSALVSGSDVEDDALTLLAFAGTNYSVSDTTITPDADYSGTLAVPVALYDGTDTSNVDTIHVVVTAVNDAPALTAVDTGLSMVQGDTLALDMDDVTATDVDNDAGDLSLIVFSGDDYTVDGSSITASSSFTGSLSVAVAVTDGQDTSNVDTLYVTVTQAASSSSSEESSSSTTFSSSSSSEGSTFIVAGANSLSAQLNIRSVSGSLDISYTISHSGSVDIAFYNVLGMKAHELHQGPQAAGSHTAFERKALPTGRYIAVLRVDGATQDRRSLLIR
ncbi:MAG TPA: GLUG motif-containing protein [Fibrobacteraceae bacterium]|nr:GLUG motif-containing protein [Fibrobacteraceae bacterium]